MKVTFKHSGGGVYRLSTGEKIRGRAAAETRVEAIEAEGVNPGLAATTKKSLDSMTDSHRKWVERFESALAAGGGLEGVDHVWAATRRDRGRAPGRVYLAVKFGAKDYRIVEFDEGEPTAAAVERVDRRESPTAIMAEFKAYRAIARAERLEASE